MEDILTWQTLVFTLAIFIFSLLIRRMLEAAFPTLTDATPMNFSQRFWEEVLLPSLPVLVGALFALLVKNWPYPKAMIPTGPRVIYGVVCGFFSTWAYRVLKAILTQKFSVDLDAQIAATPGVAGDRNILLPPKPLVPPSVPSDPSDK